MDTEANDESLPVKADADGLVLPVGATHAVVLSTNPIDLSSLGTIEATLPDGAVAALGAASRVVSEGLARYGEISGTLVRLHPDSVAALASSRRAVDAGGWVQGTLRNADGHYNHVVRFKAAPVADMAAGVANLVGALAAQAQLAAIHRDVKKTHDEVRRVGDFQNIQLLSRVQAASESIDRQCALLIDGGRTDLVIGKIADTIEDLRSLQVEISNHLDDMVRNLERAATANTPKAIEKAIDNSVSRVPTYLRALAAAHAATAQGAAFLCADLAFRGDTATEAHVRALRDEAAQSHTIINEVTGRLAAADNLLQSLFESFAAHLRKRRQVPIPFTDKKVPVPAVIPVPVLLPLGAIDGADRLISAKKNTDAQRRLSDRLWYHGEASATGRAYLDRLDALVGVIDAQAQQPRAITEA